MVTTKQTKISPNSTTGSTLGKQETRDIRRATRRQYSAEEKIRTVLDGLRSECSIAELYRREGIATSLYQAWSKEFLEAGKKWLAGDTARNATTEEVRRLGEEARSLKEVVAEQALELRLLKKARSGIGGTPHKIPGSRKAEDHLADQVVSASRTSCSGEDGCSALDPPSLG